VHITLSEDDNLSFDVSPSKATVVFEDDNSQQALVVFGGDVDT
jgi:hypothetical protein